MKTYLSSVGIPNIQKFEEELQIDGFDTKRLTDAEYLTIDEYVP